MFFCAGGCSCCDYFTVTATVRLLFKLFVRLCHALDVEFKADCITSGQYPHLGLGHRRCCFCRSYWLLLLAQLAGIHVIASFVFQGAEDVWSNRIASVRLVAYATSVLARPSSASGELADISTLVCLCLEQILVYRDRILGYVATHLATGLLLAKSLADVLWIYMLRVLAINRLSIDILLHFLLQLASFAVSDLWGQKFGGVLGG